MKKRRLLHFVPLTLRRVKRRAKFSNTASSLDPSNASFPFTIVAIVRTVRGGRWWKVSLNFSRFVVRLSNSASVRPKRKHGINWYLPKCLPQRRKGVGSHARAGNWFVFTANADRTCSLTEWSDFRAPWCLPVVRTNVVPTAVFMAVSRRPNSCRVFPAAIRSFYFRTQVARRSRTSILDVELKLEIERQQWKRAVRADSWSIVVVYLSFRNESVAQLRRDREAIWGNWN